MNIPEEFPGQIPLFRDGFRDGSEIVIFQKEGKLEIESERSTSFLQWYSWVTPSVPGIDHFVREYKREVFEIKPGDRLLKKTNIRQRNERDGHTNDGITVPPLTFFVFTGIMTRRRNQERDRSYTQFFRYSEQLDRPWYFGNFRVVADVFLDYTETNYKFTPKEPKPEPKIGREWKYKDIEKQDKEVRCALGCSCNQIAKLIQQNRQTNANLERLIQEIHKATAAGFFSSPAAQFVTFEQRIENVGKTLYSQSPGRGGKIAVQNLLDSTAALISAEYHRLGLHKFPASVPKELIPNPNQALEAIDRDFISLQNLAYFLKWQTKIDDERLGQWPIEFEVTEDGKKKKVYLWNIAEALGDIFGALIKVVEDSDIGVQWGIRSSVEASKAGNAALKTLHLLKELVRFSRALTQDDILKVQSTFTPAPLQAQSAEDMLKPNTQDLTVTNIIDRRSLLGLLLNISYWTQISGRSVYGDLSNNPVTRQPNMPGDGIRELRRRSRVANKRWDEWRRKRQQRQNIALGDQPPERMHPPDIKDISPRQQ
ncbi:hypothetical protein [Microseira wollei]|uniref:Uncharacterized protein n=1 Tax=Microseira wollei NIES-4236 TaxID=2530354 RepID=A0AAV3XQ47_9CYAN|nr:hypothetical protein [Microseira wollei]GET43001.1 hypothetical protein MiSe_78210 [Microseira wollei NIES-4236]